MTFTTKDEQLQAVDAKKTVLKPLEKKAATEKEIWLKTCEEVRKVEAELEEIWEATID